MVLRSSRAPTSARSRRGQDDLAPAGVRPAHFDRRGLLDRPRYCNLLRCRDRDRHPSWGRRVDPRSAESGLDTLISRYVTINYNTIIGDGVKIMDLTHITGNTVIEDGAFVSTMVGMTNDNAMGQRGYDRKEITGPHVESGAMIGAGATLLPRVRVGSGATVGAGAVVTPGTWHRARS